MSVIAIRGGTVLTIDAERRVIAAGGVLIEDDCIAWVGPAHEMPLPAGADVIEAHGAVVMPGLVNAHTHVAQTLLRGGVSVLKPPYPREALWATRSLAATPGARAD